MQIGLPLARSGAAGVVETQIQKRWLETAGRKSGERREKEIDVEVKFSAPRARYKRALRA